MSIKIQLMPKKKAFLREWLNLLIATYPPETARMLKKEPNQFANPVGHTYSVALGEIFDEFLGDNNRERLSALLDKVLRIRAVQDFTPSGALAFVFSLKYLARDFLKTEIEQGQVSTDELSDFDTKVDGLALLAFDVYARCREQLHEVRVTEIKNRTNRLLQRAQIIADVRPEKPEDE